MVDKNYYDFARWLNEIAKRTITFDIGKVLDVIIAKEIYKLRTNTDYFLYDVTKANLKVIEKQSIRGNSPLNKDN